MVVRRPPMKKRRARRTKNYPPPLNPRSLIRAGVLFWVPKFLMMVYHLTYNFEKELKA